jgi:two-component system, NtrC family, nitrogen regulation response regulator GlnG
MRQPADVQTRDFPTMDGQESPSGDELVPRLIPALTIISHPFPDRVGDRLLLGALAAGERVELSRNAPEFQRPGGGSGASLADPFLSRKPLVLSPGLGGRIRLEPSEGVRVSVADQPLHGARELTLGEVVGGVLLELAGRIVLLLGLADFRAREAAEALGMVGISLGLQGVRRDIEKVADLDVSVLIRGETGSGKELVARAIHQRSTRRDRKFVSVNLGALPKELAAAELFGAQKGAYTGAERDRKGFFQEAAGGTLFLDEVGEASPEVQVLLLRALETREIYPVGSHTPVATNVRLIAATDARLEQQIHEGRFKEPLLHRLAGYQLRVPPLRERREDIGLLFHHFAREELESLGEAWRLKPEHVAAEPWLSTALASRLVRYEWPGNIRQLRNVVRQLVIGSRGRASLELDPRQERELFAPRAVPGAADIVPLPPTSAPTPAPAHARISDFTEEQLVTALETNGWKIQKAAGQLGLARTTLYDWLKRNPLVRDPKTLSAQELARCRDECQGDLDAMSQRLKVSRWVIARRLKELGAAPGEAER